MSISLVFPWAAACATTRSGFNQNCPMSNNNQVKGHYINCNMSIQPKINQNWSKRLKIFLSLWHTTTISNLLVFLFFHTSNIENLRDGDQNSRLCNAKVNVLNQLSYKSFASNLRWKNVIFVIKYFLNVALTIFRAYPMGDWNVHFTLLVGLSYRKGILFGSLST